VLHSLVARNRDVGIFVFGADATIEGSEVREIRARDDARYGDGLSVRCAGFDLEGEVITHNGVHPFVFEDRGGNRCGCPVASLECVSVSAGLEPPVPTAPR